MGIATKLTFLLKRDFVTNKELVSAQENLHTMMDIDNGDSSEHNAEILGRILEAPADPAGAVMGENTLVDMQLDGWARQQAYTQGGRELFYRIVSSPTTSTRLLKQRQGLTRRIRPEWEDAVQKLSAIEGDLLWLYKLPSSISDAWPLPLLFPSMPLLRRINKYQRGLDLYHFYRIWLTPMFQISLPVMSIIGPWLYLRYRMKWKIGIVQYFRLIKFLIGQAMEGADFRQKSSRLFTILLYGFMFLYGIVQTIDVSRMLHSVRKKMLERMRNIAIFVDGAYELVSQWHPDGIDKPVLPAGMAGIYAVWLDGSLRNSIAALLRRFYELDVHLTCSVLVSRGGWTFARYKNNKNKKSTVCRCSRMRNPVLPASQVDNPAFLDKNLIITGPNAAGKSTYVRSIGASIICAQSLGICCAGRMVISPLHAILSYMRVRDVVGTGSLFETEVANCSNIIKTATGMQEAGKTAVIFFDEPMHSTPPLEGEAAAYAVLEHLGRLPLIRTVVTSHYHRITDLPKASWANLSMDAVADKKTDGYVFPYRIRPGPSFQSIAIELLRGTDKLPASVVQNALKFKSAINKPASTHGA